MINTATDNIQYRGDVGRSIYQKNQVYRRPESEHYKVCMGSLDSFLSYLNSNLGRISSNLTRIAAEFCTNLAKCDPYRNIAWFHQNCTGFATEFWKTFPEIVHIRFISDPKTTKLD